MLWLALHLPLLPLEAFCATLPAPEAARPVALLTEHHVSQVNAAAAERGLRSGIKRATALALAGDLLIAESDAGREAVALQAVAHTALAFTPIVTLHDAQTVLLEVQASLRLFGGLAALRQRLQAALMPLGHRVQMAAAPTALGAALLARWHPRGQGDLVLGAHATAPGAWQALLMKAPVWLLVAGRARPAVPATQGKTRALGRHGGSATGSGPGDTLHGMGVHTLADLCALPRAGLARRFGQDLLDELDRALGRQADPRRVLALPATFESRLELFARADTTDQVLRGASVLLARLVAWAQARHARVAAFTLRMLHEKTRRRQGAATDGPAATELRIELAEPALDAAHLQGLLRERLARLELVAPTLDLQLHCHHLVAGPAPNGELFPTHASQAEGLTRLLERLRARLGDAQVLRLMPVADHRPEWASRTVPAHGPDPGAADAGPCLATAAAVLPLHRPAWLLPTPMALAERDALPLLHGRALQLVSGPERIETGWWDGASVARDYFIAQTEDGSLVWVYRGRLPHQPGPSGRPDEPNWYLQGCFA